eukprot:SAG22_NODE_16080_length_333_cov_0.884615_1_plen_41_part_10
MPSLPFSQRPPATITCPTQSVEHSTDHQQRQASAGSRGRGA